MGLTVRMISDVSAYARLMHQLHCGDNDVAGGGSSESTETLTNIEMPPDCRIMYPELMKVINL